MCGIQNMIRPIGGEIYGIGSKYFKIEIVFHKNLLVLFCIVKFDALYRPHFVSEINAIMRINYLIH